MRTTEVIRNKTYSSVLSPNNSNIISVMQKRAYVFNKKNINWNDIKILELFGTFILSYQDLIFKMKIHLNSHYVIEKQKYKKAP
jgi:hypothetical protein